MVGYHATRVACRESILTRGLLPSKPQKNRPYGVYVFRSDGEFDHCGWNSLTEWDPSGCWVRADVWAAAYIGPLMPDQYVLNGMIFLGSVEHVSLVTGNQWTTI